MRLFSCTNKAFAKSGASKIKDVTMSWLVSRNDLESQKRKAIESIIAKGDKLQIRLQNRTKGHRAPNNNEIEARNILLQRVRQIVEQAGGREAQSPQGSVNSRMLLFYEKTSGS